MNIFTDDQRPPYSKSKGRCWAACTDAVRPSFVPTKKWEYSSRVGYSLGVWFRNSSAQSGRQSLYLVRILDHRHFLPNSIYNYLLNFISLKKTHTSHSLSFFNSIKIIFLFFLSYYFYYFISTSFTTFYKIFIKRDLGDG